jgi:hypothetical protein
VMAAMIWSVPRWHKGQVPRSRANTRLRSRAQLQCGVALLASDSSSPVGVASA